MLEFALLGVPIVFITLSAFEASLAMWRYHTMAEVVQVGARYITAHGLGCASPNTCQITVGNIVSVITTSGVGLDTSKLSVTLTSANASVPCSPVSSCSSNSTIFPQTGDNSPGMDIQVSATYPIDNPIAMVWPGTHSVPMTGVLTLGATSTQRMVF
jgi:hypothetical protein